MNAINTSSSGPPAVVSPTPPVSQPATKSATRPTTSFMALLAAVGATDAGSADVAGSTATTAADVGGAAGTAMADVGGATSVTAADVASSGDPGSVTTFSSPQTHLSDVASASGRRRHDERDATPVFAFGVPVTIATIPLASITAGNSTRPQSLAVSGMPTALLATQGNSAQDGVSAATLAVNANVADKSASSALSSSAASLAAMPEAGNAPASVVATATGQSSSVPFTEAVKADTTLTSASGAAVPSLATAAALNSAPTGDNNVGVMAAATNGAVATNVMASAAAPLKSARHSSSESMPAEAWAANIGPVGGPNTSATTASPPTHPAVTGAAQQIATQATLLHNGQSAEMQLRLRPPDLGDVRVILRRDATGALSAHLIPATREAGDVLNANLHHLRTALDQHSQGQRAEVSVGQHTVADQRQHMNGGHSSHEDETSASDPATPPAKSNQPAAQRVSRAVATNGTIDYDA